MDTITAERIVTTYERARAAADLYEPEGYEQAAALFREVLRNDASRADACAGLAETYAHWGFRQELAGAEGQPCYDMALSFAERAVSLTPASAASHRALAVALRRGDKADAQRRDAQARMAVELDPNSAENWYELWRASGYQLDDQAIKKALVLRPAFFAALHDVGVVLCEQGRPGEALRFLDRALAVNPASVLALCNRAMALQQLGRADEARASLRALAAERPAEPLVHDALAFLQEN